MMTSFGTGMQADSSSMRPNTAARPWSEIVRVTQLESELSTRPPVVGARGRSGEGLGGPCGSGLMRGRRDRGQGQPERPYAAREIDVEPARDAVGEGREDDLVEASAPERLLDGVHGVVARRD